MNLKPEVGIAKGLTLTLDAHTDLQADKSIEDDFKGFLVGVSKDGEIPLMRQEHYS